MRKTLFLLALWAVANADMIDQINEAYNADNGQKMWELTYKARAAKNAVAHASIEATQAEKEGDCPKALALYKKACEGRIAYACVNLAALYIEDDCTKRDDSMAKRYFGKACDLGSQKACEDYRKLK